MEKVSDEEIRELLNMQKGTTIKDPDEYDTMTLKERKQCLRTFMEETQRNALHAFYEIAGETLPNEGRSVVLRESAFLGNLEILKSIIESLSERLIEEHGESAVTFMGLSFKEVFHQVYLDFFNNVKGMTK